jgi:hypothetical protein
MEDQLLKLQNDFNELRDVVYAHKHKGYDLTKELPISTVYAGIVGSDGVAINLPDGWTSARNSLGYFTVTHNLGHINYVPVAIAHDVVAFCAVADFNADYVKFAFLDSGANLTDRRFYFTITLT